MQVASGYVFIKFLHIFVAIVALGTSAGLGIVLEFYGSHPTHGTFILRATRRILAFLVAPGYALMLITGLWMVSLSWPLSAQWIQGAIGLWFVGSLALGLSQAMLKRQLRMAERGEFESAAYRRAFTLNRIFGGAFGFVVVGILYLMVFKP